MYKPKNILVIGGNAAGPSAAAKAKRINPEADIKMFEAGEFISTGTCELTHVLSGEIDNYKKIVFYDEHTFLKEKGVKVFTKHFVENINRSKKEISVCNTLTNQNLIFPYDSLILCTGSKARKDPRLSPQIENLFYLKSVTDLNNILEFVKKNEAKRCLIVGASYVGLETADALNKIGIKVTLAEKFSSPFASSEPEIQNIILESLKSNKIEFIPGLASVEYIFNGNKIVKFKNDGRLIEVDFVMYSIGFEPNTELALSAKLDLGGIGGIKVNRKLQTSDPNIFAAGDNIEVTNIISLKNDYIPLASLAHQQGHIAGANAAGGNEYTNPVLKNIGVAFFGNSYTHVGLTLNEAKEIFYDVDFVTAVVPNRVKVMPCSRDTFAKIIYRKSNKQILGASFAGAEEVVGNANIIALMITSKISADKLSEVAYNYTPALSPFINILSILGRKIR
ncbi:MAG: FAD-dependent oxidoreductase [Bacteroidetes bacterium]|nr:FAD-dependent oxidoreductase [Bacteroidota bacterium]